MRTNKVTTVIGRRSTGKTTFILNFINGYRQANPGMKVLIIDTFDSPDYKGFPIMPMRNLSRWISPSVYRVIGDTDQIFEQVNAHVLNCLIICEDATKYLESNIPEAVRNMIIDSKQKNNDIIFIFHDWNMVPPKVLKLSDIYMIFKSDNPADRRRQIRNYTEVEKVWNTIEKSKNPFIHEIVKLS